MPSDTLDVAEVRSRIPTWPQTASPHRGPPRTTAYAATAPRRRSHGNGIDGADTASIQMGSV
jgi:hypothetical protein